MIENNYEKIFPIFHNYETIVIHTGNVHIMNEE